MQAYTLTRTLGLPNTTMMFFVLTLFGKSWLPNPPRSCKLTTQRGCARFDSLDHRRTAYRSLNRTPRTHWRNDKKSCNKLVCNYSLASCKFRALTTKVLGFYCKYVRQNQLSEMGVFSVLVQWPADIWYEDSSQTKVFILQNGRKNSDRTKKRLARWYVAGVRGNSNTC